MGPVHLTVADLERSLSYYGSAIGLQPLAREDGRAELGVPERTLLVLSEVPGARPADGYSGLFHFALLVPGRADLGRWLAHAARERVPLTGASDHYVSEALYLRDPDHHGIEIYWDRPREVWEGDVAQRMTSLPLELEPILAAADGEVVAARDAHRDHPAPGSGAIDWRARDIRGNFVVIRHAAREYSVLAHLLRGSVSVRPGDRVCRGQVIGRCGNSGHSTEPHLHFHVQDHPNFYLAVGRPVHFARFRRDREGSAVEVEEGYLRAGEIVATSD